MENTFGILVARWRLFQKSIDAKPERVEKTIVAAIVFYNYLRQTDNACYTPNGFVNSEDNSGNIVPGQWRSIRACECSFKKLQHFHEVKF